MVLQIATYGRQVALHAKAMLRQCCTVPDPGKHQRLRRSIAPPARITSRRARTSWSLPPRRYADADGARTFEQHACRLRFCAQHEVLALQRRMQEGIGGGSPPAAAGVDLDRSRTPSGLLPVEVAA